MFTLGAAIGFLLIACPDPSIAQERPTVGSSESLDIAALKNILGIKGTEQNGEYKVTVPQNDLQVTVDGFSIIPPMGMATWAAFTPAEGGAVVMGDIIMKESELGAVQQVLIEKGLTITGLHRHFVRDTPAVTFMHIGGMGPEKELASGVKAVLDRVAELRGGDPAQAEASSVETTLDTTEIARVLGHKGEMNQGVYKVTIGRPDVALMHHGVSVSTFMGFNTWAAWQGTRERAAVAGDFVMLDSEVASVIEALVKHGIEVVAVHNHMVHEEPRVFFLHYWGTGPADRLAQGLRAALDQTGN